MLNRIVLFILLIFICNYALANTEFTYEVIDGGIEVTGCVEECQNNLFIPETINGYDVITIGDDAFSFSAITSVLMPDTISRIGDRAFSNNNIYGIVFSESITSIGNHAFLGNQLASLTIPNSVTTIGDGAFANNPGKNNGEWRYFILQGTVEILGCSNSCPHDLIIPVSIEGYEVTSIAENAFVGLHETKSVIIPNGVKTIGDSAFHANGLTNVTIGNSVTKIGDNAFSESYELTSIIIPDSVTTIGNSAFGSSALLGSVTIPDTLISVGEGAFDGILGDDYNGLTNSEEWRYFLLSGSVEIVGCTNTCPSYLVIPDFIDGYSVTKIGNDAFYENEITTVTIPDSVTSIGNRAFSSNQITSVTIPDSVTSIGNRAFSSNQITSVTIPDSVNSISNGAFAYNQLTSLTIPNSVTTIREGAFAYNQLASVTIPDSVTSIGGSAFSHNQLTSVIIPDGVRSIGESTFSYNQLTNLSISNNLIWDSTSFQGNLGISNGELKYLLLTEDAMIIGCTDSCDSDLVIPEIIDGYTVTRIGDGAFIGNELTSVTIPHSVTSISNGAFAYNQLTSVTIPDSVTTIGKSAFLGNQLTSLTIPDSVTSIAYSAFSNNQLSSVNIPDSVQSIGNNSFYNNKLTSLIIGNSVTTIGLGAFSNNLLISVNFLGEMPAIHDYAFYNNPLTSITYCQDSHGKWSSAVEIESIIPVLDQTCSADIVRASWDFDLSGDFDALTDGILLLRYAFGLRGKSLTNSAVSAYSVLSQTEVESNIEQAFRMADIDDNGTIDALTDSLILMRYAFGLRGEDLVSRAISVGAKRNTFSEIEAYIEARLP